MIKLGILDFDTSHAVEFTKRLNHIEGTPKEQFVEGAQGRHRLRGRIEALAGAHRRLHRTR